MTEETTILLIDDDGQSRYDLETVLSFLGETTVSANSDDWRTVISAAVDKPSAIAVVLIGACEKQATATLLAEIHQWEAGTPFVLLGDHDLPKDLDSEIYNRVTAILAKTLSYQPLLDALHQAAVFHENFNRLRNFDGVRDYNMFRSLVGTSAAIQQIRTMMGQVANTEVSVLITGESGTGKEVVGRNLHLNSSRAEKPFVPINCGAIARELLESELFGHEKGAFTGAISSRAGRFELADGGTLFLDEIGDMELALQAKILRVLQNNEFYRVGGKNPITVDVRVIAATNQNLEDMMNLKRFREDLFHRLNVIQIDMPPLRERLEDVPLLANHFIHRYAKTLSRGKVYLSPDVERILSRYHWSGNIRELENVIKRALMLALSGPILPEHLPPHLQEDNTSDDDGQWDERLDQLIQDFLLHNNSEEGTLYETLIQKVEKHLFEILLSKYSGKQVATAKALGINRNTLKRKIDTMKISPKKHKPA